MSNIDKVNLTASARLIMQLGEQLIEDELVALLELIKNGYDADARNVEISIDTKKQTPFGVGEIIISDNGNGMLPSIVKNSFLRLSTNFKEEEKSSPYFHRRVLGKKGIGRLSFQRLGKFIDIVTVPRIDRYRDSYGLEADDKIFAEKYNSINIKINWSDFPVDMNFQDISADVIYYNDEFPKLGTEIKIYGIRNINFWEMDKNKEVRLKSELLNMLNPFENSIQDKDKSNKFLVDLRINKIRYPIEKVDEALLEELYDTKVLFDFKNWIFNIRVYRKKKYVLSRQNAKIAEMKKNNFKLISKEQSLDQEEVTIYDFNDTGSIKLNNPDIETNFEMVNDGQFINKAYPGNFSGVIYARDLSNKEDMEFILGTSLLQNRNITTLKQTKDIWKTIQGLFVYRNGFRILPYGKKDWLGFTTKSQTESFNIYKEHTVVGYIDIDGFTSEKLEEQTNRQGFVLDEYGKNFLQLLQNTLLNTIFNSDVKFREGYSKVVKEDNYVYTKNNELKFEKLISNTELKKEKLQTLQETISNITEIVQHPTPNVNKVVSVAKNLNEYLGDFINTDQEVESANKQELYLKTEELKTVKDIIPLLGLGIVAESLTHEMNRIEKNISSYALSTIDGIKIKESVQKLITYQRNIIIETNFLNSQINHMEAMYKKNSKYIETVDIKDFLNTLYSDGKSPMGRKAEISKIRVIVTGADFTIKANKGYLTTIFDNIFLNSIYWVNEFSEDKYICFDLRPLGIVECYDSGPGIHPEIENDLFEPFKYKKKDGRGLGLYIVSELMREMNSEIYLAEERKGDRRYKFILNFGNRLED